MGNIVRQLIGEIPTNIKGKAYTETLNKKLSPESIANARPQTQTCKKNKKY